MESTANRSPFATQPSAVMVSASCSTTPTPRRVISSALLVLAILLLAPASAAQPLLHTLVPSEPQGSENFGFSVAAVPDADADGRGDLLIGEREQVYLFSGATGGLLHTLLPPGSARSFGTAVAGVPDVDGDGRSDLLVGAPLTFDTFENAGRAYLFSGATGDLLYSLDSPDRHPDGTFGRAVAGVPDVDADGRGDLLVGSRDAGGQAYLFSGATGTLLDTLFSPAPMTGDNFGAAVAAVPDTDDDGLGDLLIGAFAGRDGGLRSGRAYLFSGGTRTLRHALTSPDPQDFGDFGQSVAGVPDTDGDGRGDLLIGAPMEDGISGLTWGGRAYVFSGATGALLQILDSPSPDVGGRFGISVSGATDVDDDGRGDFLVGAFSEDEVGRAYAFSGATGALLQPIDSPNPEPVGLFGSTVAAIPDTNGDGRDDLLVGAPQEDGGGFNAGRAYLFSGASAPAVDLVATASQTTVAPGGSVVFDYTITNDADDEVSGDLFFTAERSGSTVAMGIVRSGTLSAGTMISGSYTQQVPGTAPPDDYAYSLHVGSFPNVTVDTEAFTITVTGRSGGSAATWAATNVTPWPSGGEVMATAEADGVEAFPNPFHGLTTLRFTLDEAAEVRLTVYDVLGREVAVLHDGPAEAGINDAVFEADGLATGIYVWRLVAGSSVETGHITLVR